VLLRLPTDFPVFKRFTNFDILQGVSLAQVPRAQNPLVIQMVADQLKAAIDAYAENAVEH
jgi:hypothetical protein